MIVSAVEAGVRAGWGWDPEPVLVWFRNNFPECEVDELNCMVDMSCLVGEPVVHDFVFEFEN